MRNKSLLGTILAESVVVVGIFSTILGGGVSLVSAGSGSRVVAFFASFCVASGVLLALIAIKLHRRSRYVFVASFVIMTGSLLLLIEGGAIPYRFPTLWPLLSIFAGLSLIPAGCHRFACVRVSFLVPAVGFVVLGALFLLFSFHVYPFSFARFIIDWWPFLLGLAGICLLLVAVSARSSGRGEPRP